MEKRIVVHHGDEYRTKVSDIYQEADFFYDSYRCAARNVVDIVRFTQMFYDKNQGQNALGNTDHIRLAGYPNNIIAFCAGRGNGKTSAMLSFSSALRSLKNNSSTAAFWGDMRIFENIFYVLNPIDPTMLDSRESILQVIISRMFNHYAHEEPTWSGNRPYDRSQTYEESGTELLQQFRKCFRSLDVLQHGRQQQDCYDDLEFLADLGDSSNMKRDFQRLVTLFLSLVSPRHRDTVSSDRQFLVIQIDDADLNSAGAYQIVDELRKYCVVPNVIILMATDFDQLELNVEQHFLRDYETLWKMKQDSRSGMVWESHMMMERYLDKLIPGTRQIHLPRIETFIKDYANDLKLLYEKDFQSTANNDETESYQDMLLRLIYEKTGLFLMKPTGYLHNLLPKTMRELTHMLAFLTALPDIPEKVGTLSDMIRSQRKYKALSQENRDALNIRRRNIESFMDYLRHCWIKTVLTEKQQKAIIPAMDATQDMKIKLLLSGLMEYGAAKYKDAWGKDTACPVPQYIDVINTVNKLKRMPGCAEEFALVYASATILTLHMHLLTLLDLETGLDFTHLNTFIGDGVFPPEVGAFQYKGLDYSNLEVTYNLIDAVLLGSGRLSIANPSTYYLVNLLLTKGNPVKPGNNHGKKQKGTKPLPLMSDQMGNHVSCMRLFKNCLSSTMNQIDIDMLTQALDITLSWDLQYQINRRLKGVNGKTEQTTWLSFMSWMLEQGEMIDSVYEEGLNALGIKTTTPSLYKCFEEEKAFLEVLAIGNPSYATQWWTAVQSKLSVEADRVANFMEYMDNLEKNSPDNEGKKDLVWRLLESAQTLSRLNGAIADLVPTQRLLEAEMLYQEGLTPQSVIDKAANIFPVSPIDLVRTGEEGQAKTVEQAEAEALVNAVDSIVDIKRKIKDWQKELKSIHLNPSLTVRLN